MTTFSIAHKINRSFLRGAALLMLFYFLVVETGARVLENRLHSRYLTLIAPNVLALYDSGNLGTLSGQFGELLTLYEQLPGELAQEFGSPIPGLHNLHLSDGREYNLLVLNHKGKKLYLLQRVDLLELEGWDAFMVDAILVFTALGLFALASIYISHQASAIAAPFSRLTKKLKNEPENLDPVSIEDDTSEFIELQHALNKSHNELSQALTRERAFTHYISHEFRSPLTVLKLSLHNLAPERAQTRERIRRAVTQMESLAEVLLLLARRKKTAEAEWMKLDQAFIEALLQPLTPLRQATDCELVMTITPFRLQAHPQLVTSLISNLLQNAFQHSVQGQVSLKANAQSISVGNYVAEPQSPHDGYGVGLVLVRDICRRYHWGFQISSSPLGYCATVTFPAETTLDN
ncbi:MAG: hypothetical protein Sw2PiBPW_15730 [Shewanella algae]